MIGPSFLILYYWPCGLEDTRHLAPPHRPISCRAPIPRPFPRSSLSLGAIDLSLWGGREAGNQKPLELEGRGLGKRDRDRKLASPVGVSRVCEWATPDLSRGAANGVLETGPDSTLPPVENRRAICNTKVGLVICTAMPFPYT
jgi:hypothetical protein